MKTTDGALEDQNQNLKTKKPKKKKKELKILIFLINLRITWRLQIYKNFLLAFYKILDSVFNCRMYVCQNLIGLLNVPILDEFALTHQWPYKFNKPQWPYHSLSDWVFFLRHFTPGRQWPYHGPTDRFFLNPACETVVWSLTFRVKKCVWKKKWKNPVWETVVWSLVDQVKNLIEKKWPGLSDSGMVTGGLKLFWYLGK